MNSIETRNFFYHFRLKEDLPLIARLPDEVQASIEANIADVIYESFVVPADHDYLTARLLAQKGLLRGFYWAAAQAVEKYLKALLLLNGISVAEDRFRGHPIRALFAAAAELDKAIKSADISPHVQLNVQVEVRKHIRTFSVDHFIEDIERNGSADNRYNAFRIEYNTGHLFALDALAHLLRSKIVVPPISDSFKDVDDQLKSAFEENNPWFCEQSRVYKQIPNETFPVLYAVSTSKLQFLMKHKDQFPYMYVLQWLRMKMKLPRQAVK